MGAWRAGSGSPSWARRISPLPALAALHRRRPRHRRGLYAAAAPGRPRPAARSPRRCSARAERCGLPVRTPATLKDRPSAAGIRGARARCRGGRRLRADPAEADPRAPRLGCLNIHASLLPRWRGAAPIQRAILAGDAETGITIMQMDEGLDTGPILLQEAIADRARRRPRPALHDRLAALGARLIVAALDGLAAGAVDARRPQPAEGVTYAAKLDARGRRLDWREPAAALLRQVRAFDSVARRLVRGQGRAHQGARRRAGGARAAGRARAPCSTTRPTIACGEGRRWCSRMLQRAGRAALAAARFLRGFPLPPGTRAARDPLQAHPRI